LVPALVPSACVQCRLRVNYFHKCFCTRHTPRTLKNSTTQNVILPVNLIIRANGVSVAEIQAKVTISVYDKKMQIGLWLSQRWIERVGPTVTLALFPVPVCFFVCLFICALLIDFPCYGALEIVRVIIITTTAISDVIEWRITLNSIAASLHCYRGWRAFKQDRLWRKTRSKVKGSQCQGTDANRNFDFNWRRENFLASFGDLMCACVQWYVKTKSTRLKRTTEITNMYCSVELAALSVLIKCLD